MMRYAKTLRRSDRMVRSGFTLVELLVSISIVTILASTVLFALMGAQSTAREKRVHSQIRRLHELIATQWETYETRRVKFVLTGLVAGDSRGLARRRLDALRETMRMELPDRYTDLISDPSYLTSSPSLRQTYLRRFKSNYGADLTAALLASDSKITQFQGAEMLYLIISQIQDGDASALEFFSESEIGDADGDGMFEILDAWGTPISFLRWAPGAPSGEFNQFQPGDPETGNDYLNSPDPFDVRGLHNRQKSINPNMKSSFSFALFPLIYSAGPDKKQEIISSIGGLHYAASTDMNGSQFKNDPYFIPDAGAAFRIGTPSDTDGNGSLDHVDNITNHFPGT